ncbi:MAG TPA: protein phosphatase 2C domain-containing protein [Acidimicrobiales bacterium]|nr:protein phosphatase 2C domain-containing protein [Acidimicrobiales bacterium]
MRVSVSTLWVPRAGSTVAQYEDAFYPPADGPRHARRLRFAVADGASESMLAGLWAGLLVRTWCKARRRSLSQILELAKGAWDVELAAYLEDRDRTDRPIQWFEEPGLERGAFATLLGVAFSTKSPSSGEWEATGLGDSCLFQVRGGDLLSAFPLKSSSEFDNTPTLVPSRTDAPAAEVERGDWRTGDTFFLATDAVAAWFLRSHEGGGAPWDELAGLGAVQFPDWAAARRADRTLRNDDATVVRIVVA